MRSWDRGRVQESRGRYVLVDKATVNPGTRDTWVPLNVILKWGDPRTVM